MTYQIDQSGKIEQTQKDTVLAYSNGIKITILIRAKDKRVLQNEFRRRGEPRNFIIFVFSFLLAKLFKEIKLDHPITIDIEYSGAERLIIERVILYSKKMKFKFNKNSIIFKSVGKSSPAHKLAGKVTARKQNPDMRVTLKEIFEVLWPKEKDRTSRKT